MSKLLVIDDDKTFGEMVKNLLSSAGYEVNVVRSGKAALEILSFFQPDAVLLDMRIPDVSGLEIARRLQAGDSTRNIPVIIVTGTAIDPHMERYFKSEPNIKGFIVKTGGPETIDSIESAVKNVLAE